MKMKKYIILFLSVWGGSLLFTSCLEQYLDKAPESGLNVDAVFSKYDNAFKYIDFVFNSATTGINGRGVFCTSELGMTNLGSLDLDCVTDFCDAGRVMWWAYQKWGPCGDNIYDGGGDDEYPIWTSFWQSIRRCNNFLKNVNKLTDGNQADIDDLIGRAHFVRAFCHFELFRFWGAMPYVTQVLGPDDQWDIPRLSKRETMIKVAADMDTAYTYFEKAGKIRRDPLPGQSGHLNAPDQKYPNGVTAKAYKGRALLYAASPLNNDNGNVADWQAAAVANWEAIKLAEQNGYALLSATDYTKNYIGTNYSNEMLWGHYWGTVSYSAGINKQMSCAVFTNSKTSTSGLNPTQGTVDLWETKWGDPLFTQAERDAATALGHYNEQDPFTNRDPRFYIDIIYNTAPIPGYGTAKIYFEVINGVTVNNELIDRSFAGTTRTGYYQRKIWGGQSIKNPISPQYTCAMIRLGELYLNYAEAANEGYGPNTAAPGATMTAVQAINAIRGRWTATDLAPVQAQFTTSTTVFRPRIKNERKVELSFEAHYYFDIRRWKDAPVTMAGPLMGNVAEKVAVSGLYPTGYKYTRLPLSDDRQSRWYDAKYYLPFLTADYYKMKKFDPGQVW
jgi:starch-binding outer membrane protein, SusD/RagB family